MLHTPPHHHTQIAQNITPPSTEIMQKHHFTSPTALHLVLVLDYAHAFQPLVEVILAFECQSIHAVFEMWLFVLDIVALYF